MKTDFTLAQAEVMKCARDLLTHCRQFNPNADHESLFADDLIAFHILPNHVSKNKIYDILEGTQSEIHS